MSLVERVQDFRLARKQFLDEYMPREENVSFVGVAVRPVFEWLATYEAVFFRQRNYSLKPREEVGNVTYLH